jgi:hypothetical protein
MSLISVQQAADKLGVSGARLRLLLADSRIKGQKIAGVWCLESADLRLPKPIKPGRKSSLKINTKKENK